jgi:hypothetical protein
MSARHVDALSPHERVGLDDIVDVACTPVNDPATESR